MIEEEKLDIVHAVKDQPAPLSEIAEEVKYKKEYLSQVKLINLSTHCQIAVCMLESGACRKALLADSDAQMLITLIQRAVETYKTLTTPNPVNASFAEVYREAVEGGPVPF